MQHEIKRKPRGLSVISLLVVGAVLAYLVIIGAKVVPSVSEYMAIEHAVKEAAANDTVASIRQAFDRSADAGYITSLRGSDLDIKKGDDKYVVSFHYEKQIALGGPAYLLIKYDGSSAGK